VITPGEDVQPGHLPQLVDAAEAGKGDKLLDVPRVIVAGVAVAQIGEPLGFRGMADSAANWAVESPRGGRMASWVSIGVLRF
jgi:hypothetical protein